MAIAKVGRRGAPDNAEKMALQSAVRKSDDAPSGEHHRPLRSGLGQVNHQSFFFCRRERLLSTL